MHGRSPFMHMSTPHDHALSHSRRAAEDSPKAAYPKPRSHRRVKEAPRPSLALLIVVSCNTADDYAHP
jgi:hypothetical protein